MYNLFNDLIVKFDNDNIELKQYWMEFAYKRGIEILEKFNDSEWKLLINSMSSKSDIAKARIVYCLTDSNNQYQVEILSNLAKTDNMDLFTEVLLEFSNGNFNLSEDILQEMIRKIDFFMPYLSVSRKAFFKYVKEKIITQLSISKKMK